MVANYAASSYGAGLPKMTREEAIEAAKAARAVYDAALEAYEVEIDRIKKEYLP